MKMALRKGISETLSKQAQSRINLYRHCEEVRRSNLI